MIRTPTANAIVAAIIRDLCARGGLQNAWDEIDEETREEIRHRWADLVMDVEALDRASRRD